MSNRGLVRLKRCKCQAAASCDCSSLYQLTGIIRRCEFQSCLSRYHNLSCPWRHSTSEPASILALQLPRVLSALQGKTSAKYVSSVRSQTTISRTHLIRNRLSPRRQSSGLHAGTQMHHEMHWVEGPEQPSVCQYILADVELAQLKHNMSLHTLLLQYQERSGICTLQMAAACCPRA